MKAKIRKCVLIHWKQDENADFIIVKDQQLINSQLIQEKKCKIKTETYKIVVYCNCQTVEWGGGRHKR